MKFSNSINDIKEKLNILEIAERLTSMKRAGRDQYKGCCPFHKENTPSFYVKIKTQKYVCHGCGVYGDSLDLYSHLANKDIKEIMVDFNPSLESFTPVTIEPVQAEPIVKWAVPAEKVKIPSHPEYGKPSKVYTYRNIDGVVIGYVFRYDTEPGKKQFSPYFYYEDGTWKMKAPKERFVYGAEKLKGSERTVLVVEGEKSCDKATELFPHLDCISWMGGTNAMTLVDWKILEGRKVVYFPDCDQPGIDAMHNLKQITENYVATFKAIQPLSYFKGCDIDDFPGKSDEAIAYIRANIKNPSDIVVPDFSTMISKKNYIALRVESKKSIPEITVTEPVIPEPAEQLMNGFYKALGYQNINNSNVYWFLSVVTNSILCYTPVQLASQYIITELAPINYWEHIYGSKNGRLNMLAISNDLKYECQMKGFFDETMIRGRGCFFDEERLVYNDGLHISCDGAKASVSKFMSKFAYPARVPIYFNVDDRINSRESEKYLKLMKRFNWDNDIMPYLAAGWAVLAPYSGVLNWRPHMWVLGGAGTGKSWILQNIIRPVVGQSAHAFQGATTEPAIRQTLGHDAWPIVFDEFEPDTDTAVYRIESILELARASSSSDGGSVAKGGKAGGVSYLVKSMFCFASITHRLSRTSDLSRISMCSLNPSTPGEKQSNAEEASLLLTDAFCAGIRARTFYLLPTILHNIQVFRDVVGSITGDMRTADQIGTMMAGAYSLVSSSKVTKEVATELMEKEVFRTYLTKEQSVDEVVLLSHIISRVVRLDMVSRTIGELIYIARGMQTDAEVGNKAAENYLLRIGIDASGTETDGVLIAVDSNEFKRNVLAGSRWIGDYGMILLRTEGAKIIQKAKMSHGIVTSAISIPSKFIFNK